MSKTILSKIIIPAVALTFSLALFVGVVLADAPEYNIDINTPVSISGSDVSLSGTASATKFAGQLDTYHVFVDWGDGSSGDVSDSLVEAGKNFSGTWSGNHTYTTSGPYTIVVKLCHVGCTGAEGADATDSVNINIVIPPQCNDDDDNDDDGQTDYPNDPGCSSSEDDDETDIVVPPTTGAIIIVKDVVAADGTTDISDGQSFSVTVGSDTKAVSESSQAVFSGLSAGTYAVSETNIPAGYALVSISDDSATVTAGATTTIIVTNKISTQCNDGVDNDDPEDELVDSNDPGCSSDADNSETDGVPPPTTGTIVVVKNVVGSDGETDILDSTSFTTNVGSSSAPFAEGANAIFEGLLPGTYTISEDAKVGYALVSISSSSTTVVAGATSTITITNKVSTQCNDGQDNDQDELVDANDSGCTNTDDNNETDDVVPPTTGSIVVIKNVVDTDGESEVSDDQPFTARLFDGEGFSTTSISEELDGVFANLFPGMYELSEIDIPEGYELVSISSSTPTVIAGATTTVTVKNKLAVKDVCPNIEGTQGSVPEGKEIVDGQCVDVSAPVVDLCSNIEGNQSEVPDGFDANNDGTCEEDRDGRSGGRSGGGRQGQVLGASTSCGIYLDHFLRRGYTNDNDQLLKLQSFLAGHLNIPLAATGIFDLATENAVKQFQWLYASDILAPWGLYAPTGLVYKTTTAKINSLMCPELQMSVPPLVPWSLDASTPKN